MVASSVFDARRYHLLREQTKKLFGDPAIKQIWQIPEDQLTVPLGQPVSTQDASRYLRCEHWTCASSTGRPDKTSGEKGRAKVQRSSPAIAPATSTSRIRTIAFESGIVAKSFSEVGQDSIFVPIMPSWISSDVMSAQDHTVWRLITAGLSYEQSASLPPLVIPPSHAYAVNLSSNTPSTCSPASSQAADAVTSGKRNDISTSDSSSSENDLTRIHRAWGLVHGRQQVDFEDQSLDPAAHPFVPGQTTAGKDEVSLSPLASDFVPGRRKRYRPREAERLRRWRRNKDGGESSGDSATVNEPEMYS